MPKKKNPTDTTPEEQAAAAQIEELRAKIREIVAEQYKAKMLHGTPEAANLDKGLSLLIDFVAANNISETLDELEKGAAEIESDVSGLIEKIKAGELTDSEIISREEKALIDKADYMHTVLSFAERFYKDVEKHLKAFLEKQQETDETKGEDGENIPRHLATMHYSPISNVNKQLLNGYTPVEDGKAQLYNVLVKRGKKPVYVQISFLPDKKKNYDTDKPFTDYDRAILNAICSLYVSAQEKGELNSKGNLIFTAAQVANHISGNKGRFVGEADSKKLKDIEDSIARMRSNTLTIICDGQIAEWKKGEKARYEGHLLNIVSYSRIKKNGETYTEYRLLEMPEYYDYAHTYGQIAAHSTTLFAIPDLSNSRRKIILQDVLAMRIAEIKQEGTALKNIIKLETLYEAAELNEEQEKTDKKRIRDIIEKILEHFITENYIKGYTWNYEGADGKRKGKAYKSIAIKI